eukprot:CAMPEP_0176196722 /NCGR_PEP_ID=MMETSP0121_2-20121125/7175_1 /TAXON_ID=160619 /ORGANISM="Kryptoperidinium foliaceum, Strain CCMP 1326" /LENGTH=164 /DNA_ID=CAMNT_0017535533 /DNA_START=314 /DNA_END=805 /DNA_ORIENTATION=+
MAETALLPAALEVLEADWALGLGQRAGAGARDLADAAEEARQVVAAGVRRVHQVGRRGALHHGLATQLAQGLGLAQAVVHALVLYVDVDLRSDEEGGDPHCLVEPPQEAHLEAREPLGVDDEDGVEVCEAELVAETLRRVGADVETRHVPEPQESAAYAVLAGR